MADHEPTAAEIRRAAERCSRSLYRTALALSVVAAAAELATLSLGRWNEAWRRACDTERSLDTTKVLARRDRKR